MKGRDEDAERGGKCFLWTSECMVYRCEFPNTLSFTICCQLSVLSFARGKKKKVMAIKWCPNKLGGFQSLFINSINTIEHLLCTVPDILLV